MNRAEPKKNDQKVWFRTRFAVSALELLGSVARDQATREVIWIYFVFSGNFCSAKFLEFKIHGNYLSRCEHRDLCE